MGARAPSRSEFWVRAPNGSPGRASTSWYCQPLGSVTVMTCVPSGVVNDSTFASGRTTGPGAAGSSSSPTGGAGSGTGSSLGGGATCARTGRTARNAAAASRRRIGGESIRATECSRSILALRGRGHERAILVVAEDRLDDLLGFVVHLDEVHVAGIDHALGDEPLAEPVEQAAPERLPHQDDRHFARLARLHERERLAELVERTEAPGHHDVGGGEAHERHLAREEMAERQADILEGVAELLARQLDVEADRGRLAVERAAVR